MNVAFIKDLIEVFIIVMYLILDYICIKNYRQIKQLIYEHTQQVVPGTPLHEALSLKLNVTKKYTVVAGMFFMYEIFIHAFLPMLLPDPNEGQNILGVVLQ